MSAIKNTKCPLLRTECDTACMMLLVASKSVVGPINDGEASCAFALLASHVASEEHSGGNYLMQVIGLRGEGEGE